MTNLSDLFSADPKLRRLARRHRSSPGDPTTVSPKLGFAGMTNRAQGWILSILVALVLWGALLAIGVLLWRTLFG